MRAKMEALESYVNLDAFCIMERYHISKIEQIHPKSNNFDEIHFDKKSGLIFFRIFEHLEFQAKKLFELISWIF